MLTVNQTWLIFYTIYFFKLKSDQWVLHLQVDLHIVCDLYLKLAVVSKQVDPPLFFQVLTFAVNKCMQVERVLQWFLAIQNNGWVLRYGSWYTQINKLHQSNIS